MSAAFPSGFSAFPVSAASSSVSPASSAGAGGSSSVSVLSGAGSPLASASMAVPSVVLFGLSLGGAGGERVFRTGFRRSFARWRGFSACVYVRHDFAELAKSSPLSTVKWRAACIGATLPGLGWGHMAAHRTCWARRSVLGRSVRSRPRCPNRCRRQSPFRGPMRGRDRLPRWGPDLGYTSVMKSPSLPSDPIRLPSMVL